MEMKLLVAGPEAGVVVEIGAKQGQRCQDKSEAMRFLRLIYKQPNGCWIWLGESNNDNYGMFRPRPGALRIMAHRYSYEIHKGPIPAGMDVGHLCHDRAVEDGSCPGGKDCGHRKCINPAHLEAQTRSDNTRLQNHANRGKKACPQGHPYDEDNTIIRGGRRFCRTCARDRQRRDHASH